MSNKLQHWLGLLALVLILQGTPLRADEPDEKSDFTQMAKLRVVLTDENNAPVAGAEVMPYAMRMKEQQGHGYWNNEVFGPPKAVTSDETGTAMIEYPPKIKSGPNVLTTSLVTFSIKHTDFVQKAVHFNLGPERAKVELKPGCELRITAVDGEGEQVEGFGVVMAGSEAPDMWANTKDGGRRTRSINDGTWQTMLVKEQTDGPTLFSELLPVRVRPKQMVLLNKLQLRPGAVVQGTLSNNIPRPVKQGYVIATSVPLPAGESWDQENPSLLWRDFVEVNEDGSFVFESLPRGGKVQLIAVCDGAVSTTTVPNAGTQVMGQLFDVDRDQIEVVLEMEPTGTLEVTVETTDGKPVTEGTISSWPNQRYFKGGSTLLGQRSRSMRGIQSQLLPAEKRTPIVWNRPKVPYHQKLDQNGTATLKGIPLQMNFGLYLSHDRLSLTNSGAVVPAGEVNFMLPTVETVELNLGAVPVEK